MHLNPGVVHNFPKAVGVLDVCALCTKRSQIPVLKREGSNHNKNLNNTLPQNSYDEHEVTAGKTYN